MKVLYGVGIFYLVVCLALLFSDVLISTAKPQEPTIIPRQMQVQGTDWFSQMKPRCNAVEIDTYLRTNPPPHSLEGKAYTAACYALAGKIDEARNVIELLPQEHRVYASSIVFNVGHPVADAGDDRSAGPIMRLTIEYQPDNYMALYHAGVSEHILGEIELSRKHLKRFLELYSPNDYYRQNALSILSKIDHQ